LTQYVTDEAQRAPFARALVDKLVNFSFEEAFTQRYDFFAAIFEYLIKDYNTAGGGKYAEYYTPHSIATIMARLLVGDSSNLHNIECYDPSAGTGTLLMALSHQIGEDRCTIFAQDISQRSNKMLKLNLILNGLVSSLDHAIQGDTLVAPYHKSDDGQSLRTFDFVVSNPPFKMDFSDTREKIAAMPARFWAGVPNVPAKKKESMAIYTCFIQHVINSLKKNGKGAIVIPTGFITSKSGVENKILKHIVDEKIVYGCVSMPSNVFATTGTNVSVLFFDNSRKTEKVVLIDASKMGEEYKDGNNQKRRLRDFEIEQIVSTFQNKESVDDFSVAVTYDEIKEKKYSLAAGQYFDVKIDYIELTQDEFNAKMAEYTANLKAFFSEGNALQTEIMEQLKKVKYE
jgi:type I restriction enzyme M protein